MQQKTEYSPEDATWEELTLRRTLEDTKTAHGSDYDSSWSWGIYSQYADEQVTYRNKEGQLHKLTGPAVKSKIANYEFWYKEGERHREGGPAYIHKHIQKWYYEGKLHRLDGPAIIGQGRPKEYWIHGQKLSPKNYKKEIERRHRKGLL